MATPTVNPGFLPSSRSSPTDRARVPWVDRLEYAVRSRGAKVVVLALVANTMVAQLLYNSAGQLVLSSAFLLGYLFFSAVCSTVAFALFEVSTIFQLHDLHTLDASIKSEIGADKLIRRGYLVLVVSSLINFLSVLYFLALAWHSTSGSSATFPSTISLALELAVLRRPCAGLYAGALPRRHLWRASRSARRWCWRRNGPEQRRSNCGGCKPRRRSRG